MPARTPSQPSQVGKPPRMAATEAATASTAAPTRQAGGGSDG
jgi:hypothetical protein